jgi:hypothetical protein
MNDTHTATECNAVPHDPAMFSPMTTGENTILNAHLTSGWHKQGAVYPLLSEPWRETGALIDDLSGAWWKFRRAERGEPEAPEAGA